MAAAALLLRGGSPCRVLHLPLLSAAVHRSRFFHAAACPPREGGSTVTTGAGVAAEVDASGGESKDSSEKMATLWGGVLESKRYRDREAAILKDIEPIRTLTKEILHSGRYRDGERLSSEDEKAVVENLLVYHPHSEDKIGCGIDCIMVDRHPRFRNSRCLFVVRTDGVFIDFSYQKCLREYVRIKHPTSAERTEYIHMEQLPTASCAGMCACRLQRGADKAGDHKHGVCPRGLLFMSVCRAFRPNFGEKNHIKYTTAAFLSAW